MFLRVLRVNLVTVREVAYPFLIGFLNHPILSSSDLDEIQNFSALVDSGSLSSYADHVSSSTCLEDVLNLELLVDKAGITKVLNFCQINS